MLHLKLTLAYDGTEFVGWQRQLTGPSIQGLLEDALVPLAGEPVVVAGAGRTDAGVHALGQVASITLPRDVAPDAVVRALNVRLPPSIRVLDATVVGPEFHARFSARAKTYRYRLWNGPVVSPFEHAFVWHIPGPGLDIDAMRDAAARLVGRHDFASFRSAGGDAETTVRTIHACRLLARTDPVRDPLITFEVHGDGFLRHMVRTLVGSLVEVGHRRRSPGWIDEVIGARERGRAGRTAPASGLFLVAVEYE